MTTVTVSGFKIRKGERLYGTYVRYALYKATVRSQDVFTRCVIVVQSCGSSAFSGGKKSCVRVDQNGEKSVNQG